MDPEIVPGLIAHVYNSRKQLALRTKIVRAQGNTLDLGGYGVFRYVDDSEFGWEKNGTRYSIWFGNYEKMKYEEWWGMFN